MAIRVTFPTLIAYSALLPIPLFKQVQEAGRRMAQYAQQAIRNYQSVIEKNPENPKRTLFTKMFNGGPEGLKLQGAQADNELITTPLTQQEANFQPLNGVTDVIKAYLNTL